MRIKDFIDELVEKILGRKLNKGLLQFIRYLFCGGVATASDISMLFFLNKVLFVNHLIAAAFAFITGVTINYTLNTILVFQSSGKIKKEFPLFAVIGIGGLLWTELILWLLVNKLNFYLIVAKLIAVALVLIWNFFMRKKFVFYPEPIPEDSIEKI